VAAVVVALLALQLLPAVVAVVALIPTRKLVLELTPLVARALRSPETLADLALLLYQPRKARCQHLARVAAELLRLALVVAVGLAMRLQPQVGLAADLALLARLKRARLAEQALSTVLRPIAVMRQLIRMAVMG
jgi:hypothetical protein